MGMPHAFDDQTVTAVLGHMNSDHTDDNILIARAFGADPAPAAARMTGFDGEGGEWIVTGGDGETTALRVPWPGGSISARPAVRREIVALYDESCARLGITPRPH